MLRLPRAEVDAAAKALGELGFRKSAGILFLRLNDEALGRVGLGMAHWQGNTLLVDPAVGAHHAPLERALAAAMGGRYDMAVMTIGASLGYLTPGETFVPFLVDSPLAV